MTTHLVSLSILLFCFLHISYGFDLNVFTRDLPEADWMCGSACNTVVVPLHALTCSPDPVALHTYNPHYNSNENIELAEVLNCLRSYNPSECATPELPGLRINVIEGAPERVVPMCQIYEADVAVNCQDGPNNCTFVCSPDKEDVALNVFVPHLCDGRLNVVDSVDVEAGVATSLAGLVSAYSVHPYVTIDIRLLGQHNLGELRLPRKGWQGSHIHLADCAMDEVAEYVSETTFTPMRTGVQTVEVSLSVRGRPEFHQRRFMSFKVLGAERERTEDLIVSEDIEINWAVNVVGDIVVQPDTILRLGPLARVTCRHLSVFGHVVGYPQSTIQVTRGATFIGADVEGTKITLQTSTAEFTNRQDVPSKMKTQQNAPLATIFKKGASLICTSDSNMLIERDAVVVVEPESSLRIRAGCDVWATGSIVNMGSITFERRQPNNANNLVYVHGSIINSARSEFSVLDGLNVDVADRLGFVDSSTLNIGFGDLGPSTLAANYIEAGRARVTFTHTRPSPIDLQSVIHARVRITGEFQVTPLDRLALAVPTPSGVDLFYPTSCVATRPLEDSVFFVGLDGPNAFDGDIRTEFNGDASDFTAIWWPVSTVDIGICSVTVTLSEKLYGDSITLQFSALQGNGNARIGTAYTDVFYTLTIDSVNGANRRIATPPVFGRGVLVRRIDDGSLIISEITTRTAVIPSLLPVSERVEPSLNRINLNLASLAPEDIDIVGKTLYAGAIWGGGVKKIDLQDETSISVTNNNLFVRVPNAPALVFGIATSVRANRLAACYQSIATGSRVGGVAQFELSTGRLLSDIQPEGGCADVAYGANGDLYVSGGQASDRIWMVRYNQRVPELFVSGGVLAGEDGVPDRDPNGIQVVGNVLLVGLLNGDALVRVYLDSREMEVIATPNGGIDGMKLYDDDTLLAVSGGRLRIITTSDNWKTASIEFSKNIPTVCVTPTSPVEWKGSVYVSCANGFGANDDFSAPRPDARYRIHRVTTIKEFFEARFGSKAVVTKGKLGIQQVPDDLVIEPGCTPQSPFLIEPAELNNIVAQRTAFAALFGANPSTWFWAREQSRKVWFDFARSHVRVCNFRITLGTNWADEGTFGFKVFAMTATDEVDATQTDYATGNVYATRLLFRRFTNIDETTSLLDRTIDVPVEGVNFRGARLDTSVGRMVLDSITITTFGDDTTVLPDLPDVPVPDIVPGEGCVKGAPLFIFPADQIATTARRTQFGSLFGFVTPQLGFTITRPASQKMWFVFDILNRNSDTFWRICAIRAVLGTLNFGNAVNFEVRLSVLATDSNIGSGTTRIEDGRAFDREVYRRTIGRITESTNINTRTLDVPEEALDGLRARGLLIDSSSEGISLDAIRIWLSDPTDQPVEPVPPVVILDGCTRVQPVATFPDAVNPTAFGALFQAVPPDSPLFIARHRDQKVWFTFSEENTQICNLRIVLASPSHELWQPASNFEDFVVSVTALSPAAAVTAGSISSGSSTAFSIPLFQREFTRLDDTNRVLTVSVPQSTSTRGIRIESTSRVILFESITVAIPKFEGPTDPDAVPEGCQRVIPAEVFPASLEEDGSRGAFQGLFHGNPSSGFVSGRGNKKKVWFTFSATPKPVCNFILTIGAPSLWAVTTNVELSIFALNDQQMTQTAIARGRNFGIPLPVITFPTINESTERTVTVDLSGLPANFATRGFMIEANVRNIALEKILLSAPESDTEGNPDLVIPDGCRRIPPTHAFPSSIFEANQVLTNTFMGVFKEDAPEGGLSIDRSQSRKLWFTVANDNLAICSLRIVLGKPDRWEQTTNVLIEVYALPNNVDFSDRVIERGTKFSTKVAERGYTVIEDDNRRYIDIEFDPNAGFSTRAFLIEANVRQINIERMVVTAPAGDDKPPPPPLVIPEGCERALPMSLLPASLLGTQPETTFAAFEGLFGLNPTEDFTVERNNAKKLWFEFSDFPTRICSLRVTLGDNWEGENKIEFQVYAAQSDISSNALARGNKFTQKLFEETYISLDSPTVIDIPIPENMDDTRAVQFRTNGQVLNLASVVISRPELTDPDIPTFPGCKPFDILNAPAFLPDANTEGNLITIRDGNPLTSSILTKTRRGGIWFQFSAVDTQFCSGKLLLDLDQHKGNNLKLFFMVFRGNNIKRLEAGNGYEQYGDTLVLENINQNNRRVIIPPVIGTAIRIAANKDFVVSEIYDVHTIPRDVPTPGDDECSAVMDCNNFGNSCALEWCSDGECQFWRDGECCAVDTDCEATTCTVATCVDGRCFRELAPECECLRDSDCEDGDPCTPDTCNTAINRCRHETARPGCCSVDTTCDDADDCTRDVCLGGQCYNDWICEQCLADWQCNDGNECTIDFCEKLRCNNIPIRGCCVEHTDCNDFDPCTTDTCNEDGTCTYEDDGVCDCSSLKACTNDFTDGRIQNCVLGQCLTKLTTPYCNSNDHCNDDIDCTNDVCVMNSCIHVVSRRPCPAEDTQAVCDNVIREATNSITDILFQLSCDRFSTSIMVRAILQSQRTQRLLNRLGDATIFIPTDQAWGQLVSDTAAGIDEIISNSVDVWLDLVLAHVIPEALSNMSPESDGLYSTLLDGVNVEVRTGTVNGVPIVSSPRLTALNNVAVYLVDAVLIPTGTNLPTECQLNPECEDDSPCTVGSCFNDVCVQSAIEGCTPCNDLAQCDDGDFCTFDACEDRRCIRTNLPIPGCPGFQIPGQGKTPKVTTQSIINNSDEEACTSHADCEDGTPCTLNLCDLRKGKCISRSYRIC